MTLRHSDGREVVMGDIVWYGRQPCVFVSFDTPNVAVQTTCDRRYFMSVAPELLNLRSEANHE